MATIQLTLPDQQLAALQSKAESVNLTVDELLKQPIESLLDQSAVSEKAMDYVLTQINRSTNGWFKNRLHG